ncbi:MotA/TolQ/ExbB proton channel family protein [Aquisphaera giovannonii]|uniref:MotA/TolQ/ExbB proton channel family protein n=1 Tax=Aquisphaera giovannonii TaxID=406548 RepID=A0A5B9W9V5_9BACT|nr:MotA/TolQ/ExbB proton channel family protein [Aquisphaera giovannonii]QEH37217.1 MotA/TolQ/ExbB proton channel family protein [Aquisphaera giovannonii]
MRLGAASNRCLRVLALSFGMAAATAGPTAAFAEEPAQAAQQRESGPATVAERRPQADPFDPNLLARQAARAFLAAASWYRTTPPGERMTWGGLSASAVLGAWVLLERLFRLRRKRIVPAEFAARFLDRLNEGRLDGGKALDYCEMNPSPAARVALAAVRRWGRPVADLERAVTLAGRVEADRLRRNVGTLRRIAVLAPLIGLLGSLLALGRVLAGDVSATWGAGLASALTPLTLGVGLATLALVAYDALAVRIERLAGALDRLGAETIDAIAMARPSPAPLLSVEPPGPRSYEPHPGHGSSAGGDRSPHQAQGVRRHAADGPRRTAVDHEIGF